VHISARER